MIKKVLFLSGLVFMVMASACAQKPSDLPYRQIPDYPETYSAATVAARMVDGLGFRFYWATEGLRAEDLEFRPNDEARTTAETIDHIYELTIILHNSVMLKSNGREEGLTFKDKRAFILTHLKVVSNRLKASTDVDMGKYNIEFGNDARLPFWNLVNGPIADALWHCGQIVSFRRSSGNPFNGNVDVLTGTVRSYNGSLK